MKVRLKSRHFFLAYWLPLMMSLFVFRYVLGMAGFSSLPYVRLIYGVCFLTLIVLCCINVRFRFKISAGRWPLFSFFPLLGILWLSIGIANQSIYVVTDFVYYLLFVGGYYVFFDHISRMGLKKDLHFELLSLSSALMLVTAMLYFISLPPYVPVLLFCFSVFASYILVSHVNFYYIFIHLFVLILVFPDLNRAFLGILVLLGALIVYIKLGFQYLLYCIVALVLATVILLSNYELLLNSIEGTLMARRLQEIVDIFLLGGDLRDSVAIYQRIYEAELVFRQFFEQPYMLIFGYGFGPVLDMTYSEDTSVMTSQLLGANKTHNVHLLPVAILFRYGLVGLFLYFGMAIYVVIKLIQLRQVLIVKEYGGLVMFSGLYLLGSFINALTASSYLFVDPLFSICFALFCYSSYRLKHK